MVMNKGKEAARQAGSFQRREERRGEGEGPKNERQKRKRKRKRKRKKKNTIKVVIVVGLMRKNEKKEAR